MEMPTASQAAYIADDVDGPITGNLEPSDPRYQELYCLAGREKMSDVLKLLRRGLRGVIIWCPTRAKAKAVASHFLTLFNSAMKKQLMKEHGQRYLLAAIHVDATIGVHFTTEDRDFVRWCLDHNYGVLTANPSVLQHVRKLEGEADIAKKRPYVLWYGGPVSAPAGSKTRLEVVKLGSIKFLTKEEIPF